MACMTLSAQGGKNFKPGDANGDGSIDETDIIEVVNAIMGKPSEKFVRLAADVNGDDAVNIADIVEIVKIIKAPESGDGTGNIPDVKHDDI